MPSDVDGPGKADLPRPGSAAGAAAITRSVSVSMRRRSRKRSDRLGGARLPCGLLMVLEPFQGRKADRVVGRVAEHQAVPRQGLVEPAGPLPEVGQAVVQLGVRLQAERGTARASA